MRAAKIDRNQPEIVAALKRCGATVQSLASVGDGVRWNCAECGAEKPNTAHQRRQTYCSYSCMSSAYKTRLLGASNPNHSHAGNRLCTHCGVAYHSYNKARKFCGQPCYIASKPKAIEKLPKAPRLVKTKPEKKARAIRQEKACLQCASCFSFSPSQSARRFCSYQCHLNSGGAFRAGLAARKATMKYGVKKDANHNEIFNAIKEHCAVYDLSSAGCGVPDGAAYVNNTWQLFDVKNPRTGYGRRGLNPIQKKWVANWRGGPVYLIYTPHEAKEFALGNFDDLKVVTPETATDSLKEKAQ